MKILTISFMLFAFYSSKTFGQALYTQIGTDKPWSEIIADGDIPIGVNSTAGITGSKIDVNNELVEGGLYAEYDIEQNSAIHTVGNGTVNRPDFHKWSRWYQEDGKTSVYRLQKGEYNVRNDRKGAPRIESESKHVWYESDNKWQEWVGRYTIVKAQKLSLFQIFSDADDGDRGPTGLMMLGLKPNGELFWNRRDGKTFKTMMTNTVGKSFDIKIRDNGRKYEIYLNGELFVADETLKRIKSSHFRWGMYGHEAMPGDAMIFISHVQINGESVTNENIIGPKGYVYTANENETVAISSNPMDIAYGQDGNYVYLENQTNSIPCSNTHFGSDPFPGVKKYCFVRESKAPYSGIPISIPGTIEAEDYDFGGQDVSYHDNDPENRGAGESGFRTNHGVDIAASTSNGNAIGWTEDGEWMEYTVDVASDGLYEFVFSIASKNGGGELGLNSDGKVVLTSIEIPQTNDWNTYSTIKKEAMLQAGQQVFRFIIENRGFNIDKIVINKLTATGTNNLLASELVVYPNPMKDLLSILNLEDGVSWRLLDQRGITILQGNDSRIDTKSLESGVYFLELSDGRVIKVLK